MGPDRSGSTETFESGAQAGSNGIAVTGPVAIIGGGVIGCGWAARFLLMGWDVRLFDPDPGAPHNLAGVLENARAALPGLSDRAMPTEGRLSVHDTISQAVAGAGWIQESVPERLALKRKVYQKIQAHCAPGAIIASSTSGYAPDALQGCATRPGQIIVARAFDPVYLLPLVELLGSPANPLELSGRAGRVLADIGMFVLPARGHIAGRLHGAMWREALSLVDEDLATTPEIDAAIRMGPGLVWAQMGLFEAARAARGEAGIAQADAPELTGDPMQNAAQSGADTRRELKHVRDRNLVAMLRALTWSNRGAGAHLVALDAGHGRDDADITRPIATVARAVPLDWVDYNGHMTEWRYAQVFSDATDRLLQIIGCDAEYIATGGSFFTAESHILHLAEAHAGANIRVQTTCLGAAGKTMHIFHEMFAGARLLATGEHMLIHVSLSTRRAAVPAAHIAARLAAIARAHADLARPDGVGRAVGQGRPAQ